jgi:protein phosphatase
MVRFDEIREVLVTVAEPLEACRVLTDKANQAGGHDNITVIVAKVTGEGLPLPSPQDDLRYRKYPLPEEAGPSRIPPTTVRELVDPRTVQPSGRPPAEPPAEPPARVTDHGPSRSKVTNTIVGGAELQQAALAAAQARAQAAAAEAGWQEQPPARTPGSDDGDPIFIPTSNAPAWMVGGVVLTALALALVAGYYLLR